MLVRSAEHIHRSHTELNLNELDWIGLDFILFDCVIETLCDSGYLFLSTSQALTTVCD